MRAPAGIHAEAAGDGPAIVLVHAGICDSGMWDAQWRTLPAAYRVVRFDMRGFGRSPLPSVAYSHARDLLAVMDAAPGRAPEDVDAAVRRRAHAMQLRALELQVPAYEADGDLEELLVPDAGDRLAEVAKPDSSWSVRPTSRTSTPSRSGSRPACPKPVPRPSRTPPTSPAWSGRSS